jgi:ditrans,polycis-polyprenyl diphosphate synthase
MKEGVCVQIVGDWNLVPDDLRPIMAKVMVMTRHNTRAKLNVAFAYTGMYSYHIFI